MKIDVPQILRPFFPFYIEDDLPQQIILKNDPKLKIHVYFLLLLAFAESLLALRESIPLHFIGSIFFFSGSIITFFANEADEIMVSLSGITLTRKFLFFPFKRHLPIEQIQSIKYSIETEDIDIASGYIIINRIKGRAWKIFHLRRSRNQILADLSAIRDRLSQILFISTEINVSTLPSFTQQKHYVTKDEMDIARKSMHYILNKRIRLTLKIVLRISMIIFLFVQTIFFTKYIGIEMKVPHKIEEERTLINIDKKMTPAQKQNKIDAINKQEIRINRIFYFNILLSVIVLLFPLIIIVYTYKSRLLNPLPPNQALKLTE
ncbi:MAG: hypothetical protein ABSD46_13590 [Bacteroidota bacterium]